MLAIPSWAIEVAGLPEVEREHEEPQKEGILKGREREFSCKEQPKESDLKFKNITLQVTDNNQAQAQAQAKETKKTLPLTQRIRLLLQQERESSLALTRGKIERGVESFLPRSLPRSALELALPKLLTPPVKSLPVREQVKTSLPVHKEGERESAKEEASRSREKSEVAGQAHHTPSIALPYSRDQEGGGGNGTGPMSQRMICAALLRWQFRVLSRPKYTPIK